MIDTSGTTNYTYSNRDQVLTKATPQGTLTYAYDLSGNAASVVSSNANGTNVSYAWDADNRLSSVTDNRTSGVTNYTYDATSQLSTFAYPNGVSHAFTYDNRDRTTNLNVTGPGPTTIATYTQTFGFSGHKLTANELSGRSASYSYDNIYRLLTENIASDPTPANNGLLTYTLDPVGNRSSLTSTLAALSAQSFTYDAADRISGDTFDANGNTLTSGGVTYTGKERDAETGLDYFGARYMSSAQGRFTSPDWSPVPQPVPYADLTNPQSLNLYAYVKNNPLSSVDPDGHLESPWHFGITFAAALRTHHGFFGSLKLAWDATWVDFRKGSQGTDAEHANWHSMEGKKANGDPQTQAEADAGTAQVVSDAQASGDTALAVHAVEDQATPLHEGHPWTGINGSFFKHLLGDLFPSPKTVGSAYDNAKEVLQPQGRTPGSTPNPLPGSNVQPLPQPQQPCLGCNGPPKPKKPEEDRE
jgi:RHS repeat-associated protein